MNLKRRLAFMCALVGATLLTVGTSWAQSGQIEARQGQIEPHLAGQNPLLEKPQVLTGEPCEDCLKRPPAHKPRVRIPADPRIRPEDLRPSGPPTYLTRPPTEGGQRGLRDPGDFTLFRNHALTPEETGPAYGYVMEPTFGVAGRTVFWAGNFHAAVSGDYGQTFSPINPSDNFPFDGVVDSVMQSPFCCDQVVYYDRTSGAYFWLLLYHVHSDVNTNVQRIAVANSQEDVLNNNWFWYDFSPSSYGYPAAGYWLDFPYLTVSNGYLYHVTKFLDWTDPPPIGRMGPTRTLIARYPLAQMSQGQPMTYDYLITDDTHGTRCTHGAGSTMYFGAHLDTGTMRIYRWPDSGGTVEYDEVDHEGFSDEVFVASGPDGLDWVGHMDNWIQGAWVANGVIGFMFGSAQGDAFPYPHVQVLQFRESDRSLLSQNQIWNPGFAFMYPSVHPNDRGHLGGTIAYGGGTEYPGATAWIADDINGGSFAPLENVVFAVGESGPINAEGDPANRWGDYLTARRNVPYGNTWGGSGHSLVGGSTDQFAVGRYVWFGRERDTPTGFYTIYVDHANQSGYEDGTPAHPFNTVTEGHFAAMAGDTIIIRVGDYPEVVTLDTPVHVFSEGGSAVIGP
ncbi:hypothetical protein ACFL6M_01455 [Candidatus Eisenbacteria bacterium]|uniref:DUF1565 domain-containing protein n=1 Tax=Eiseniibacteriota bacterium TaxID=2212470 RepID=A0ABV6YIR9_UNCEI